MGCVQACLSRLNLAHGNSGENEGGKAKEYSWDKKRENVDTSKYIVQQLTSGNEEVRLPGSINGEQFTIQNCEGSSIYLFDHINTLTIDDCKNCKIFAGPITGSLFIRDCSNCTLVAACGQFRTRDCKKLDTFLFCATQPIIEASSAVRFACFQYWYPELRGQFGSSGLSPFDNLWWNIHDFTPSEEGQNWSLMGECYKVEDFLPPPALSGIEISTEKMRSVVPLTSGNRRRDYTDKDFSLVLICEGGDDNLSSDNKAVKILEEFSTSELELIRTRKIHLDAADLRRIFGERSEKFPKHLKTKGGSVLALQFGGQKCLSLTKEIVQTVVGQDETVFCSENVDSASKDIRNVFNFVGSQMGI